MHACENTFPTQAFCTPARTVCELRQLVKQLKSSLRADSPQFRSALSHLQPSCSLLAAAAPTTAHKKAPAKQNETTKISFSLDRRSMKSAYERCGVVPLHCMHSKCSARVGIRT
eukprot:7090-Heterococcus_DN1.PRE.2